MAPHINLGLDNFATDGTHTLAEDLPFDLDELPQADERLIDAVLDIIRAQHGVRDAYHCPSFSSKHILLETNVCTGNFIHFFSGII